MNTTKSTHQPCQHIKANGKPCQAFAVNGSNYCFWHDPAKARERGEARSRGGKTTMGKPTVLPGSEFRLDSLASLVTLIEETINQVRTGAIEVRIAQVTGYLAGVAIKAMEQAELEKRAEALEQIVSQRGSHRVSNN